LRKHREESPRGRLTNTILIYQSADDIYSSGIINT
jgi:hypothetical protein